MAGKIAFSRSCLLDVIGTRRLSTAHSPHGKSAKPSSSNASPTQPEWCLHVTRVPLYSVPFVTGPDCHVHIFVGPPLPPTTTPARPTPRARQALGAFHGEFRVQPRTPKPGSRKCSGASPQIHFVRRARPDLTRAIRQLHASALSALTPGVYERRAWGATHAGPAQAYGSPVQRWSSRQRPGARVPQPL